MQASLPGLLNVADGTAAKNYDGVRRFLRYILMNTASRMSTPYRAVPWRQVSRRKWCHTSGCQFYSSARRPIDDDYGLGVFFMQRQLVTARHARDASQYPARPDQRRSN